MLCCAVLYCGRQVCARLYVVAMVSSPTYPSLQIHHTTASSEQYQNFVKVHLYYLLLMLIVCTDADGNTHLPIRFPE